MNARITLAAMLLATAATAAIAGGARVLWAAEFNSAQADLSMSPGKQYKVRVNAENKGAKAWLPGEVTLVGRWSTGPGSPKGIETNGCIEKLPRAIPTKLAVQMTSDVTGPSMPGDWVLTLAMAYKGKPFGDTRDIKIRVETDYKADVSVRYPAKMDVNRKYTVQVKARNTGLSDMDSTRIFARLEIKKQNGDIFREFKGKQIMLVKLPKTLLAGEPVDLSIPLTPQSSGDCELEVTLWDAEESDEITSPEPMKLKIQ
jgi:hypothetical protein